MEPGHKASLSGVGSIVCVMKPEVVALWFSDIEGSTQVLLRTGDAYDRILNRHREIVRKAFAEAHAEEHGTEGDSFFAVFPTARAAVGAAIAVQRALRAEPWPDGGRIAIRIGLHLGEVQRHPNGDLTGLAVHLAARVMSGASGEQVVVTRAVRDQLDGSVELIDLGEHVLKDMPQAVALFQVAADGLRRHFPPLRTAPPTRQVQLPSRTTSFVGRSEELVTGGQLLDHSRLLSLVGPPGCGKTRLALELASRQGDNYEVVTFVDLAAVERPEQVGLAIALAAGVEGVGDPVEATAMMLDEKASLLVLDNCEHVLEAAATAVETLISRTTSVRVLATSQVPLGRSGEAVLPLAGFKAGAEHDHPGRQLFVDRCGARGVHWADAHTAAIDELVERLDNIPLAIELAAALAVTMSPRELLTRLDRRFDLLTADGTMDNPRHTTLRGAIAWGYEQLSGQEQRLAGRLAVAAGTFDIAAAESLGADGGEQLSLPTLHRLVRAGWIVRADGLVGSRYRMLESLREYAFSVLDDDGRASARAAHTHHFLRLVHLGALDEEGPSEAADFALVDEDLPNILLALRWAIEQHVDLDAAAETFLALSRYWQARPSWRQPHDLIHELLPVCRSAVDLSLEAQLLDNKAFYDMMVGGASPIETIDEAGELARRSGSSRAILHWLHMATQVYGRRNDAQAAMRYADELVEEALRAGSHRFAQMGLLRRGTWRLETEGVAAGEADIRRGLALAPEGGNLTTITFALNQLARLAFDRGDAAQAMAHAEAATIVAARSGHRIAELAAGVTAAGVSGDRARDRASLEAAIDEARRLGTTGYQALLLQGAAAAALEDGDVVAAEQHMAASDALDDTTDGGSADAWLVRAAVYRATGRSEAAVRGLRSVLAHARDNHLPGRAWQVLWILAGWDEATDDPSMNARIKAAAEHAFTVFAPNANAELLYGIRFGGPDSTREPLDLDEATASALRTGDPKPA